MISSTTPSRTYLGTRCDSGWTRCSRSDCQREHAEHHEGGDTMLCPVTVETLTDEDIQIQRGFSVVDASESLRVARRCEDLLGNGTELTTQLTAMARQLVCDAINARRAKET